MRCWDLPQYICVLSTFPTNQASVAVLACILPERLWFLGCQGAQCMVPEQPVGSPAFFPTLLIQVSFSSYLPHTAAETTQS